VGQGKALVFRQADCLLDELIHGVHTINIAILAVAVKKGKALFMPDT
jgi:hypothetical protein